MIQTIYTIYVISYIIYTMISSFALFSLLYHPRRSHVLHIAESSAVDLLDMDFTSFAGGMDMRPHPTPEPTLHTLQYIHARHQLYMRLTDFRTSILVKELLAQEFLEEDADPAPNVFSGGLLNDWDFDIDITL